MLEAAAQWHECIRIQLVKGVGNALRTVSCLRHILDGFRMGFIEGCLRNKWPEQKKIK
jgi:hypothetical protein